MIIKIAPYKKIHDKISWIFYQLKIVSIILQSILLLLDFDMRMNQHLFQLHFEFYDGQTVEHTINKEGSNITGIGNEVIDDDNQGDDGEKPGEETKLMQ